MDYFILFNTIAQLSFTIQYNVSHDNFQEFFVFHGNQSHAKLFREYNLIKLYLNCTNNVNYYKLETNSTSFDFSWPELSINHIQMYSVNHSDTKNCDFNHFKFISPFVQLHDPCGYQPLVNSFGNMENINYGYFVLIMVFVILSLKLDFKTTFKAIISKFESDYVSMRNIHNDNTQEH